MISVGVWWSPAANDGCKLDVLAGDPVITQEDLSSWRAALLRHRDFIENARLSMSRDRDKMILAIAGGSLTVSVALLERTAGQLGPWQVGFLVAGWTTEIFAIVLVLRSLSASERAIEKERERVDCMLSNADGADPEWSNPSSMQTERLNTWASAFAIAGIVFILLQSAIGVSLLRL